MKQRLLCLVTCALALTAGAAHAQAWLNAMGGAYNFDYVGAWAYSHNLARSVPNLKPCGWATPIGTQTWVYKNQPCPGPNSKSRAQTSPRGASAASLYTGKGFATKKGIYQLVAPVPAENQPEAAQMFTTLILTFEKTIPRTYGIPANNLASAYAAALAGSYAAYTNRPFPENAVKPLFEQAQQAMLDNPQISQVSLEDKAAMYQVWVGMGMYLLGWQANLAKHPDSQQQAKMQKAGADALRSALAGADPSRVRFTTNGMQLH
jgi:hypothetical protein